MSNDVVFKTSEEVSLSSRKKWLWVGIVIALINPVFSGLIFGLAFWSEPKFRKEGRMIVVIAIVWGVISLYLLRWLTAQGYLPVY